MQPIGKQKASENQSDIASVTQKKAELKKKFPAN